MTRISTRLAWPPTAVPEGIVPLHQVMELVDLLAVLGHTPLIVPQPRPAPERDGHRTLEWCQAWPQVETGTRYLIRPSMVETAERRGEITVQPVWRSWDAPPSWRPLYPMTSAWLRARLAGWLDLGNHLGLP